MSVQNDNIENTRFTHLRLMALDTISKNPTTSAMRYKIVDMLRRTNSDEELVYVMSNVLNNILEQNEDATKYWR